MLYGVLDKYMDFLTLQKCISIFYRKSVNTTALVVRIASCGSMITSNSAFVNVFFQRFLNLAGVVILLICSSTRPSNSL